MPRIETKGAIGIRGGKFVPLAMAGLVWREGSTSGVYCAAHDGEDRALWIGENGKPADPWDIRRGHQLGSPVGQKVRCHGIDVFNADIADPARFGILATVSFGKWHEATDFVGS